ncbi:MAG TPA: alpha/beta fold hydrolase [Bacteroidia bacterium]|nr:alpha/beta fold hydrolase [Bacteroidia bacterium]
MTKVISYIVERESRRPIQADIHYPETGGKAIPLIIFLHGFKGFKDWGHWPLVAEFLARSGFVVIRFNFSHNGTTRENPMAFGDLDAFAKNTFSKELEDVEAVLDDIVWRAGKEINCDPARVGLLGHSRGGGIAFLAAFRDKRVRAVAAWAGISDLEPRVNPPELDEWKKNGVIYTINSRTGESLPINYSLREDFYANKKRLDIPYAVKHLNIPILLVSGTKDESVPFAEAEKMSTWNMLARFEAIAGAGHTFGGKHPWTEKDLPADTVKALQPTIAFFRENL